MNSSLEIAVPIPLKIWQDPQGDVILHHTRDECFVYFGCWAKAGEPANYLGKLIFQNAWAVRGLRLEFIPYEIKEHKYHSCIYAINDSQWLTQMTAQRLRNYPDWKSWDTREYLHYVISGHDNYYDIIATEFHEQILAENEAGELARLIYEA